MALPVSVPRIHACCVVMLALASFAPGAQGARRHSRGRKAVPLQSGECREPHNLEFMLTTWRNEMQLSDPPMESFDEEWLPPQPQPKICEVWPKTGKTSNVMERSLCPWQWRQNHDEKREPKIIAEAFCLCKTARGNSSAYCMPIRHEVAVLRRSHCDPVTRIYHYTKATQSITIGCHSVFARTARASPLSSHYRIAPGEI